MQLYNQFENKAGIHYDTNMDRLTITRQHMTAKPKMLSFIL